MNMKKIILFVMTAFILSGCPGGSGSKSSLVGVPPGSGYGYGYTPPCLGCTGYGNQGNVLVSAQAFHSQVQVGIEIIGDSNQMAQIAYSGGSPSKVYMGNVSLRGVINLTQGLWTCGIGYPVQLQITGYGTYNMGQFSFPNLQSNGLPVSLSGVIVDADANGYPEGFGAQLSFPGCDPMGFTVAPY
jgi:hypothetical protein